MFNNCCCPNCRAAFDDFERETIGADWSEDAGAWSIVDGELTTSDSDARISYVPGFIANDFRLEFKASDGDEIVLSDGTQVVVITVGAAGTISNRPTITDPPYDECTVNIPADEWVRIRIKCGTVLYINDVEVFGAWQYGFAPTVLGTGTIASPVYFNNYEQRYTYDAVDHPDCPPCGGDCRWFPNGEVCSVSFEINGASDVWNGTYWEYYSRLNGMYVASVLNDPFDCMVKISGLDIDLIEEPGSELNISYMFVSLDPTAYGYRAVVLSNGWDYAKYVADPEDACSGNLLTLPDNGPSIAELGVAIIEIP